MDVRDLAPALIAIADLFTSANKELNGENAEVRIEVRGSFKAGSFHSVRIFVQSLASQIRDLFAGPSAGAFSNALAILGALGIIGGGGLIGLTGHHMVRRLSRNPNQKSYSSHIQRKYFQPLSMARPRSRVSSQ
ncbi:hypothetical protein [Burkholderia sp. Ac-20392]|uniref:hypothetical protein n=1 Tax=Burkholderia sp. Ac-20392 TaxID=2703905 RepID=UPI001F11ADEC|nr:hypothetical protein [Burkholderia sp. Ac-20392]